MSRRVPSTPKSQSLRSHPSTTPAGPPPTWLTDKSTTPAGPPPQGTLGSSFNPSNNTFGRKGFAVPDDEDDDDDDDVDFEYDDDDAPAALPSLNSNAWVAALSTASPRGLKRSRNGQVRPVSDMGAIAKDMSSHSHPPKLLESDDAIILTESLVSDLDARVLRHPGKADTILTETAAQLTQFWRQHSDTATKQGTIGPRATDGFSKANYVGSLLLQLHLPHAHQSSSSSYRPHRSTAATFGPQHHAATIPQALFEWLDTYHMPFPDDYDNIHLFQPAPSAHESFWDIVYASTLRGKFERTIRLLKDAGWQHAESAIDDGSQYAGYTGAQLQNTEEVVSRAVDLLETCPAVQSRNWDVKGAEWTSFRQRTAQALADLESFAEDPHPDSSRRENVFERSGASAFASSLSAASRRAESRVPWTIYENLKLIYGLLLGRVDDIIMASQDWLEGAIYLTAWWDGSDESDLDAELRKSSGRRSAASRPRPREVDIAPGMAYRRRLANAFAVVTENPEDAVFTVNTLDPVQVAAACVLEDDVTNAIRLLRPWSLPITVATVELAALGNWLPLDRPKNQQALLEQGFSKEDLIVLSHGPAEASSDRVERDRILSEYSDMLLAKPKIHDREGWELAVAVLSRLDDTNAAKAKITDVFDEANFTESAKVNKVLKICNDLDMAEHGRSLAERFADTVSETYPGLALIYYARAMASNKLKSSISVLTSMCLLHSTAMPTVPNLDPTLAALVQKDRPALKELAVIDLEAATLLSNRLSGYATLRQFYDLRDHGLGAPPDALDSPLRPLARQRTAAAALFNLIRSAVDCIPGGLFDPSAEAAVPVAGLLALFGEALPFLGGPDRNSVVFTQPQVFALLAACEDYAAAAARIQQNAASFLTAALTAYRDEHSTATGVFKRPRSDVSLSSWDLLASSSVPSQVSDTSSGVRAGMHKKLDVPRAWDWRHGLVAGFADSDDGAQLVLQLFRQALVKEVGRGWSGGVQW